ncbi:TfoX/Sxy family protein [Bradyrhizobium sp. AUGA SZCCT0431]|uniref:TfoX/Sxy family protein n=1 Tax=Bradyrhizobium sp. AUGA SZCCT0431 TaxID=2807674 RepID=UPI00201191ED|nr:TfoX/Sxy family protein [Bradyrhizobium sp. AUGA SZCCT0431]
MVASATYAEFLREQLAPLGRVTMRRMFGKTGVFCDGVMFAMVTENTLYFRVDDQNREIFKEAETFPPLNYAKKGAVIDLSFWRVPERLFDEPDELIIWALAAFGGGAPGCGEAGAYSAKQTEPSSSRRTPGPITPGSSFTKGLCHQASIERSRGMGPPMRNCASAFAGTTWNSHRPGLEISGGAVEPAASERCTMTVSAQRP